MAKKAKKTVRKARIKSEPSTVIQAGIVFVVVAAIVLIAYAFKNFT